MTAMDSETLVTFHFRAPPEVYRVDLLGSWDNFTRPYSMQHDRRRGKGHWSGCFKFDNIIFDGRTVAFTRPRSGALKQGGMYWYFYRLDDQVEACDDALDYTSSCPLLPGQSVNVIEVPVEQVEPLSRPLSAHRSPNFRHTFASGSASTQQTLEPSLKYRTLSPPPPSRIHPRCVSDEQLGGRLEREPACRQSPSSTSLATLESGSEEASRWASDSQSQPIMSTAQYHESDNWTRYSSSSCDSDSSSWSGASPGYENEADPALSLSHRTVSTSDSYYASPSRMSSYTSASHVAGHVDYSTQAIVNNDHLHLSAASSHTTSSFNDRASERFWHVNPESIRLPSSSLVSTHSADESRPSLSSRPTTRNSIRNLGGQIRARIGRGTWSTEISPELATSPFEPSPTFSAATMSSKGIQTPLRLSSGFFRNFATVADGQHDSSDLTVHRVTAITQSTAEADPVRAPNTDSTSMESTIPRTVPIHSTTLPLSTDLSLTKPSLTSLPLLPPVSQDSDGVSMAEAIFSELGF